MLASTFLKTSILFLSVFFAVGVSAQTAQDIALTLSPNNPEPGSVVRATLKSYSLDLDRAGITWSLNGKVLGSGIGNKEMLITTPSGEMRLLVSISIGQTKITKTLNLNPGSLELIWEAPDTHVPALYLGKALPAPEATIRVVAMPEMKSGGATINPRNLVYEWKRNGEAIPGVSGYGKRSFTFRNSYLNESENISVSVSSSDGSVRAQKSVLIPITNPFVLFYEYNPLRGIRLEKALGNQFNLEKDEATVVAESYYFSPKSGAGTGIAYEWRMNGNLISVSPSEPMFLSLRPEDRSGVALISVSVSHASKILQEASRELTVNFGR